MTIWTTPHYASSIGQGVWGTTISCDIASCYVSSAVNFVAERDGARLQSQVFDIIEQLKRLGWRIDQDPHLCPTHAELTFNAFPPATRPTPARRPDPRLSNPTLGGVTQYPVMTSAGTFCYPGMTSAGTFTSKMIGDVIDKVKLVEPEPMARLKSQPGQGLTRPHHCTQGAGSHPGYALQKFPHF